ncbi:MAG: cupin domain-containing protein [Acidobacteriota bacterium]
MKIEKWNPAWGELNETNMRQRLMAEGYTVARYIYPPGTYFSPHTHGVDKKDTVLRGCFKLIANDQEFLLEAGDMLEIPAGTVHSAEVIGNESVVSLDATK